MLFKDFHAPYEPCKKLLTPCRGPGGVAASDAAFPTTHGKKYQGTVAKNSVGQSIIFDKR